MIDGSSLETLIQAASNAAGQAGAPPAAQTDDAADADEDKPETDTQTPDDVTAALEAVKNAIDAYNANDSAKAVEYFRLGAYKYHDARAQNDLAKFYANGVGTQKNYPKALKLFRRAASHSTGKIRASAEKSVGVMYAKGWGVPQDPKESLNWMNKSATHGNIEAKKHLAMLQRPALSPKPSGMSHVQTHEYGSHMRSAHVYGSHMRHAAENHYGASGTRRLYNNNSLYRNQRVRPPPQTTIVRKYGR